LAVVRQVRVAATEDHLWLARVDDGNSTISHRTATGPWVAGQPLNAPIASLASAGTQAYAFLNDGSFYRYADTWQREKDLPDRRRPVHMISANGALYAIVESAPAALLPASDLATQTPTTRRFDPHGAPLSIVRYDTRGWSAVCACPPAAYAENAPGLTPRLSARPQELLLFWMSPGPPPQIQHARLSLPTGDWNVSSAELDVPELAAFWPLVVNRAVILLTCISDPGGEFKLRAYRLVESAAETAGTWEPAELTLSPLPDALDRPAYADAYAFNQHLGILVTSEGQACLQFGRLDGPPAMQTFDVYARPAHTPGSTTFRAIQALAMLAMVVIIVVFYRPSISQAATLPTGWELAFTSQRLLGCAIDLIPFSLAAAVVLHLNWTDAWRRMGAWAFHPELGGTGLPERPYLLWWFLSAGGCTVYSLVLELITHRTVGKVCARTYLLSSNGTRPAAWQILIRNLSRFIELLPPLWILGFLAILSRNRQRAGDLFARTLCVRPVAPPPDRGDSET